ncbi:delta(3,5)-Delta(2,4)-dienoyl-CoA isomerase, mitochondrial [Coccinella septempunctata]|uniref:delta(3,5)-Delta(2,4)-dienoyl-CoA isomerase, mitochondrial n=1 Tax=Coccinella septempunctata TaxID=41139 RepID=UPI001D093DF8|nr:delta(3,5)-Delta(2,4)-dienoyl-CoA isomerase, mitochondrial [Coccinella septempunctata]
MFMRSMIRSGNLISNYNRGKHLSLRTAKMFASTNSFETLNITVPKEFIYHVEINRPDNLNAMNNTLWMEIKKCFQTLGYDENCRVIVLSGAGKIFCAGLDFLEATQMGEKLADHEDIARRAKILKKQIVLYQECMTSLELCQKPVLAAVHSACVGAGVDMITAADMRYCTQDAWFQIKEVDIGMAADVGTLQRLPKVIGSDSLVRELCYTARKLKAEEAASIGLVSRVFPDKESMMQGVLSIAEVIASKSPVAVQLTKENLVYSRDHTVQEGLDHIASLNQMALQSEDFINATVAAATKDKNVVFAKL